MDSATLGLAGPPSTPELEARITGAGGPPERRQPALLAGRPSPSSTAARAGATVSTQSCAHWLQLEVRDRHGRRPRGEGFAVSHALEQLPSIGAAMGRGGTQLIRRSAL